LAIRPIRPKLGKAKPRYKIGLGLFGFLGAIKRP
jgi:hypothetical protein